MVNDEDRQRRRRQAGIRIVEELGNSSPPIDDLFEEVAREFDLTVDEVRDEWERTTFGLRRSAGRGGKAD